MCKKSQSDTEEAEVIKECVQLSDPKPRSNCCYCCCNTAVDVIIYHYYWNYSTTLPAHISLQRYTDFQLYFMFWTHLCLIHEWRFRSRTLILTLMNLLNQTHSPFYAVNLPQMYIFLFFFLPVVVNLQAIISETTEMREAAKPNTRLHL